MLTIQAVVWLAVNLIQGSLRAEFADPLEWGFPIGIMLASLGLVAVIRWGRLAPATIVRIGLIYEVVISLGIAGGTYYGAFASAEPQTFEFDRVGLTFVAPWMLMFSVLVPAPPREAVIALLASASAVPLAYLIQVPRGLAPALADRKSTRLNSSHGYISY